MLILSSHAGSILEFALFAVEKGARKHNARPVENHAIYCNLHGRVGMQSKKKQNIKTIKLSPLRAFQFSFDLSKI